MNKLVSVVDEQTKCQIESYGLDGQSRSTSMGSDDREKLIELGLLVPAQVDELNMFRESHEKSKHDTTSATFVVFPTFSCNLRCPYCYQGQGLDRPMGTMSSAMAKNVIDFITTYVDGHGTESVLLEFHGGEPFANSTTLLQVLDATYSHCSEKSVRLSVEIYTNGTLITEEIARALQRFSPTVVVSLDGPKLLHDTHRFLGDGSGTFEKIMHVIQNLLSKGVKVEANVSVATDNAESIAGLIADLTSRNIKIPLTFNQIRRRTNACASFASSCIPDKSWGGDILPILHEMSRANGFPVAERPWPQYVFCDFQRESGYVISPSGDLYRCIVFAGDRNHRVGYLHEGGLPEFSDRNHEWLNRDPMDFVLCRTCSILPLCAGGCTQAAFEESQTYNSPNCYLKTVIKANVVDYYERRKDDAQRSVAPGSSSPDALNAAVTASDS